MLIGCVEVKVAKYELSLGLFVTNPKRVKTLFKKIAGDKNVVIYGGITTGKQDLAQALSSALIEWDSGKEPMLKFQQVGEASLHVTLLDAHYFTPQQIAKFLELVRSHNKRFILTFLNESQMLKYIHMIEKYDFIEIDTGDKLISQIERVGWFNSLIKPPFVAISK